MGKNMLTKLVAKVTLSTSILASFALNVYAEKPKVDFIDVSHHNSRNGLPLSFYQTIKASGVNGVVVKVSEGTYYLDEAASVNIANSKAAGLVTSAYHFARFDSIDQAKAEARWFDKKLQLVGFDKKKDGYLVIDVEDNNLSTVPFDLTIYTNNFLDEMRSLGYAKLDIYSGSYYYNNRLLPNILNIDKPWLAAYPSNPQKDQPTVKFSNGKGAWQWSSDYVFNGMSYYGRFDVSEDYSGKYTNQVKDSTVEVKQIGNISLVDYMHSNNMDFSFANRSKLAESYGIVGYSGTSAQNLALLSKLQSGVKPGKVNLENSQLTTNVSPTPVSKPKVTTSVSSGTYKVVSGDSLSKIAKNYNTTVSNLASLNGIKNPNVLRVGQVLRISNDTKVKLQSKITTNKAQYYIVKSGDVVSKIASKFGVTSTQIKNWNGLNKNYLIHTGQKLRVK